MSRSGKAVQEERVIALVDYPGAQQAALYGLEDLFRVANELHSRQAKGGAAPRMVTQRIGLGTNGAWGLTPTGSASEKSSQKKNRSPFDAIVLPPSLQRQDESKGLSNNEHTVTSVSKLPGLGDWLRLCHEQGSLMCSICAGAWLLAESGLLDERPATTHWAFAQEFQRKFPKVELNTDRLIVDDGDILTAGGVMAWADLGLRLVERWLGASTMINTAKFFLIDPAGREQRFYTHFVPDFGHGDSSILRCQRWVQRRLDRRITIADMAHQAGMSERTFLRHFLRATSLRPSDYLQQLRLARARELLEARSKNVTEIAWSVGYEDLSAFRKLFTRRVGLTPAEYRRRFAP